MAASALSFDEIPYDWRVPGTYVEVRPDYTNLGLLGYPARALLIGPKRAAGTAAADTAYRITRREQATALFGAGSVAEAMAFAFLACNTTSDLSVMGMEDPQGGAAATATLTLTGSATAAGTLAVAVGNRRATAPVATGATVTAVATALAAAINALADAPATAIANAGVVTLTARHAGVIGNAIDLRVSPAAGDMVPAGISAVATAFTAGAGDGDVTAALAAVAADWYTDIAIAWSDGTNLGVFTDDLARRYGALGKLDAHGYVGLKGSFGSLSSAGSGLNSHLLSAIGADGSASAPWEWAAALCGLGIFHFTNDPARQLRSLALTGIAAPVPALRFTMTEQDLLLRDGVSTWEVGPDGTVRLQRVITTYQVSALNIADTAWLDATVPKTLSRIRYDWASYVGLQYPRHKLADDGSAAVEYGEAVATPRRVHGSWAARCALYEQQGWIEDARRTVAESVFQRSAQDRNRLDAKQKVRIVGNLMVLAASLQFEV